MPSSENYLTPTVGQAAVNFGPFLKMLRHRLAVRQLHVLAHLPGWTQANYSRVETNEIAPAFDQLAPLYRALYLAGVELTPRDRQQFLTLARLRIEVKKTCRELKTDQEWDALRLDISRTGQGRHAKPPPRTPLGHDPSRPQLLETRHLLGREDWLASVTTSLHGPIPKKLVVLQGPVGIGKSSELHRLAAHFLSAEPPRPQVLFCELPSAEQDNDPESALDLFLATLLAELGPLDEAIQVAAREARINVAVGRLEKVARPLLVLLDNAEHLLDERGAFAPCWKQFLATFLRRQHRATLVLATKDWPGWFEGERIFLAERTIPALSTEEGATLLQRLGLASVSVEHLRQVSEGVGGIPLCLEWVASLVQEPMWSDRWDDGDDPDGQESPGGEALARRLLRLLDDAALFEGPLADRLSPLLERIMENRLSEEARKALRTLALATLPLGKPALQVACPRPSLLRELRAASLLASYPQRTRVLPMVAAVVRASLAAEQRRQGEEQLIEAYQCWLGEGKASEREMGAIIAELAVLFLKYHRFLDAAELLIY